MGEVMLVSGFVPLPGREHAYAEWGERLEALPIRKKVFFGTVERCWLYNWLRWQPAFVEPAPGDNPQKNTREYHIVQHQKLEWMAIAAQQNPDVDVFVWVDYGIFHVPGINEDNLRAFLKRVATETQVTLPGCRTPDINPDGGGVIIDDNWPCWRFCGGIIICPHDLVIPFRTAFNGMTELRLAHTRRLTWEVNTLAHLEVSKLIPMKWYYADHNQQMVENYAG